MIDYTSALQIIKEDFSALILKTAEKDITGCAGDVLAENVISDSDLPPFDNSAMDGFAVKFNKNIRNWSIAGEISAGNYIPSMLNDLNAIHVMTGARLPDNCDTVISVEDLIIRENEIILNTNARYIRGLNIRKQGEDLAKGVIAIEKNTFLTPQHIALAAACGKPSLKVYDKFKIGILTTGDELIDINEKPENDKIRATNLYALIAAVKETGQLPVSYGFVKDNRAEIRNKIVSALSDDIDVLITTGGVSVGKFDYVKDILNEIGVEIRFHKINIKPGKPVLYGIFRKNSKIIPVFGLPGNPVSSLVTFSLFVKENILLKNRKPGLLRVSATLQTDIGKNDGKRHFVRGILRMEDSGEYKVSVTGKQSSGNLAQMSKADCLIIIEEERINPKVGERVQCILI